ncbi:cocaine esterase-like isoform X2 [Pleurodeles waltl]|uniref:cocaine esterase-like isoform X2 n=1 Tax=Pleurodeles waltl TaxID=8319 RepID=UPI00370967AF
MITGNVFLLLCLTFNLWIAPTYADGLGDGPPPTVNTRYGKLKGRRLSVKGTDQAVDGYFGIPFAKPPVGPLRFSPPKPAEPWNNIRDASAYPPMCLQNVNMSIHLQEVLQIGMPVLTHSEDCLYLNIYTPATTGQKARLPVMVWIHGGALVCEGASMYDGSALSAYENVIVVAIQYRLGILGFFSTGDDHASGNWGFLDQVAALQWVQENIASFGGDPDSVTIFGESAGGVSVSAQILSPLSKGLFHKAVSESGVALLPGMILTDPDAVNLVNNMVANLSNCETGNSVETITCMRKKTEEEILKVTLEMPNLYVPAVVDGIFLPKSPEELLVKKEYNPVPYVVGFNNDECGWLLLTTLMDMPGFEEGMNKDTTITHLANMPTGIEPEYHHLILEEYIGDTDDPIEVRNRFVESVSDMLFVAPSVKTAKLYRESGYPIYMYEFQHRPSIYKDTRPYFVKSDHGDEVGFVFGAPFLNNDVRIIGDVTVEEEHLSRTVMKYWANFARNGNPNGHGLPEWRVYDHDEQYLEISLQLKMGKQFKDRKMKFWTATFQEKINAIIAEKQDHTEL